METVKTIFAWIGVAYTGLTLLCVALFLYLRREERQWMEGHGEDDK